MHVRAFLLLLSLPVISDPRWTYIVYLSAACPTTSSPFRILILCHLPRPKPVPGYWMLAASPRPPAWFYARLSLSSSPWVTFYLTFLLNKLCCIWICLCPLIYYSVTFLLQAWGIQPITMHWIVGQSQHTSLLRTITFFNLESRKHIALHQIHKIMFFLATSYIMTPLTKFFMKI